MLIKFREWVLQEAISLQQAAKMYGYRPGDVVDQQDLIKRGRKLMMQHHPDRRGDPELFKQAMDGRELLQRIVGQRVPGFQQQQQRPRGQQWQAWQPPTQQQTLKQDVQNELNRAITAIKRGQPEDAFAAVSRLVDPNTGKLNNPMFNKLLKTSLSQWLDYYNQPAFQNYLEPILVNALKLI